MKRLATLLLVSCATLSPVSAQIDLLNKPSTFGEKPHSGPKVDVQLLAAKTGLVPGETVDLAIRFTIAPEKWHVYWRHAHGGLPPKFQWQLPPGFEIGPIQWPAPHRFVDESGSATFILKGSPTLLTTLKVPSSAQSGTEVTIGANVSWLVCATQCVAGKGSISLKLPIVKSEQAEDAHGDVFSVAQARIPLPTAKAKYLNGLEAVPGVDKVRPGDKFKVAVVLDIKEGHHLNSNHPLSEHLTATDLFNDDGIPEGLIIDDPVFPPAHEETTPAGEKLSVYRGKTVIILPIEADPVLKQSVLHISGVVTYQACNDAKGQCYPATAAEWSVTLPVGQAGEAVAPVNAELFSGKTTGAGSTPMISIPTAENTQKDAVPDGRPLMGRPTTSESTWGRLQSWLLDLGIFGYLLMALVGGFLLNLMPCVLPVISIKILSFVQQARENRVRVLMLGLSFSGGILISFIALGVLIVGAGQQWGGLFQNSYAVIFMAALVTAFSLSLFGVFTLQPPRLVTKLGAHVQQEGLLHAFGMGLLATALGTACTAPFLGLVIALAAKPGQPVILGMLIFLFAGIGMAFPYLLLAANPGWLKIIPRPGAWMKTFEHLMGFLLLGTVVWLLDSVQQQLGGEGLFWSIVFLLFVSLAAWFYGKAEFGVSMSRRLLYYTCTVLALISGWSSSFSGETSVARLQAAMNEARHQQAMRTDITGLVWNNGIPWVPYSHEKGRQAVQEGYTIFVDYTASWCGSCKSNEKLFINTVEVRETMQRLGVVPFKADFSSYDPAIKADLDKYQRAGVPMYLIIPAERPADVILLDELITSTRQITDALEKAGPSRTMKQLVMKP